MCSSSRSKGNSEWLLSDHGFRKARSVLRSKGGQGNPNTICFHLTCYLPMEMSFASVPTIKRSMHLSGGRQNYCSLSQWFTSPLQVSYFAHVKHGCQGSTSHLFQFRLKKEFRTNRLFQMKMIACLRLVPLQLLTQTKIGYLTPSSFQDMFSHFQTSSHVSSREVSPQFAVR